MKNLEKSPFFSSTPKKFLVDCKYIENCLISLYTLHVYLYPW